MLGKIALFVFVFLGVFAFIMASIPSDFYLAAWTPEYYRADKAVASKFSTANITIYGSNLNFNLTLNNPQEFNMSLPSGNLIRFHFREAEYAPGWGFQKVLSVTHASQTGWFGWWWEYETVLLKNKTGVDNGANYVGTPNFWAYNKAAILLGFDSSVNGSVFTASCQHIMMSLVILPVNATDTLSQSWDNGAMQIMVSYEFDYTASGFSIWSLIVGLFTFHAINVGVPGWGGDLINLLINTPLTLSVYYLAYKLLAGLIPTASGGSGD